MNRVQKIKLINELNRAREMMGLEIINEQEEEDVVVVDDDVETQETPEEEAKEDAEDAEIIDDEITDEVVQAIENPEDEDTWLEERWEDLTDAVKNIFSRAKLFRNCRGATKCPDFNSMRRRRKRRILSNIQFTWPRFKFRLPWQVRKFISKIKPRKEKEQVQVPFPKG